MSKGHKPVRNGDGSLDLSAVVARDIVYDNSLAPHTFSAKRTDNLAKATFAKSLKGRKNPKYAALRRFD